MIEIEYSHSDHELENKVVVFDTSRTRIATSTDDFDFQMHQEALGYEKASITSIRTVQQDIIDLVRMRKREEHSSESIKSKENESRLVTVEIIPESNSKASKGRHDIHHDYLSPFLLFVEDEKKMTKEEAHQVRESFLKTMKERLMERANIIQTRLDEEMDKLVTIQEEYQKKKKIGSSCEKKFEEVCAEKNFRIKILEKRLEEHNMRSFDKYKVSTISRLQPLAIPAVFKLDALERSLRKRSMKMKD